MSEILRSNKLNKSSRNQLFLHAKKLRGKLRWRDPGSRTNQATVQHDMGFYAEYREISTSPGDDGKAFFKKTHRFPRDYFSEAAMPIVFNRIGYTGPDKSHVAKVMPIVVNPLNNYTTIRYQSQGLDFEEGMDYFANTFVVSPTTLDPEPGVNFMPVDWGSEEEKLQISSMALNQMMENSEYLYHYRLGGVLRNVDYKSKNPDFYLKFLNNNLLLYGAYVEFNPTKDDLDKHDEADQDVNTRFVKEFDFPKIHKVSIFKPDVQPVVIFNIGAKVISDAGTEIRSLTGILKRVDIDGFKVQVRDLSDNDSFSTEDTYFISYIVIGERFPLND